jgi:hypothetical protein
MLLDGMVGLILMVHTDTHMTSGYTVYEAWVSY